MSIIAKWVSDWAGAAADAISKGEASRASNAIDNMVGHSAHTHEVSIELGILKREIQANLGCDIEQAKSMTEPLVEALINAGPNGQAKSMLLD